MQEINAHHFTCLGIFSVDGRTLLIIAKPDQTAEAQEICFFWIVVHSAVVKLMVCLYPKIKAQHDSILL